MPDKTETLGNFEILILISCAGAAVWSVSRQLCTKARPEQGNFKGASCVISTSAGRGRATKVR